MPLFSLFCSDESLDFVTARELISSIVAQIKSYRDDSTFKSLHSKVAQFCTENQIDISKKIRAKTAKKVAAHFNDCIATLITGHRPRSSNPTVGTYRNPSDPTGIQYDFIGSCQILQNYRWIPGRGIDVGSSVSDSYEFQRKTVGCHR
ncbi:unnamed protein product, partial [Rotaria magnacalcarata]